MKDIDLICTLFAWALDQDLALSVRFLPSPGYTVNAMKMRDSILN